MTLTNDINNNQQKRSKTGTQTKLHNGHREPKRDVELDSESATRLTLQTGEDDPTLLGEQLDL